MPTTSPPPHLHPLPLSPTTFLPFGTITSSTHPPSTPSHPANQGTAITYPSTAPLLSTYQLAPSRTPAHPSISLYLCHPRPLRSPLGLLDIQVMERHPYTTQTFSPLGLAPTDASRSYLVVVAPERAGGGRPDMAHAKAFLGRGNQAVTYGVGVWHSPMVVLGGEVGFLVVRWGNGVEREDCEEVWGDEGEGVLGVVEVGDWRGGKGEGDGEGSGGKEGDGDEE